jgi:hypothetical protein
VSYGWTRRGLNASAASTVVLGADRSLQTAGAAAGPPGTQGNHADGWNVVTVDARVRFVAIHDPCSPFTTLGATAGPDADHLAMEWAGSNPAGKAPPLNPAAPGR